MLRYRCPTVPKSWPLGMTSSGWTGARGGAAGTNPAASARSMPSGRSRYRKWVSESVPNGSSANWTPPGRSSL